jgi:hypothetical protein
MKRPGRPPAANPNPRKPRALRLTDEEYATLRDAASRTGEEWAAWLRRVALEAAKREER